VVDKRDQSPEQVFGTIERFADLIVSHSGERFDARVTRHELADRLTMYAIEPPFGGNTYVLEYYGALLFVDCGLGCFEREMTELLEGLFSDFSRRPKSALITHPDIDSAGLLRLFDTVYLNRTCYNNYNRELKGRPSYRERNPLHAPYNALTKILSHYETPQLGRCAVIGARQGDDPLELIGSMRFGDWTFEIYEGAGGHARGETVITCPELNIAFTGDLLINDKKLSDTQREYLNLQPYLMASFDADPDLAAQIRKQLTRDLAGYTICPGRGPIIG
jgi:glyoxylase-like metal-dependent hydrolase (beta-lactamase superfamily II)